MSSDYLLNAKIKDLTPTPDLSRHFMRKDCPFFIEFVAPPASVGTEPVKSECRIKTKFGTLFLLTPTDTVKDRLAAFYHWNDPQALEQAVMVAAAQKINFREVKRWSPFLFQNPISFPVSFLLCLKNRQLP